MFTNFKQKEGIFVNRVGIFVFLFVCVRARMQVYVQVCFGVVESMHFPFKYTTCLISQSDQMELCNIVTQLFIMDNDKNKPKATFNIYISGRIIHDLVNENRMNWKLNIMQ